MLASRARARHRGARRLPIELLAAMASISGGSSNPANPIVKGEQLSPPVPSRPNPNRLAGQVKVSAHISPNPEDQELQLLQQMGVEHCYVWLRPEQVTAAFIASLKSRIAEYGLALWNAGCMKWAKNPQLILAGPEREAACRGFVEMLRTLGQAGVNVTTFTWEPDGVWSTDREPTVSGRGLASIFRSSRPFSSDFTILQVLTECSHVCC